jgi:hypothetical protein
MHDTLPGAGGQGAGGAEAAPRCVNFTLGAIFIWGEADSELGIFGSGGGPKNHREGGSQGAMGVVHAPHPHPCRGVSLGRDPSSTHRGTEAGGHPNDTGPESTLASAGGYSSLGSSAAGCSPATSPSTTSPEAPGAGSCRISCSRRSAARVPCSRAPRLSVKSTMAWTSMALPAIRSQSTSIARILSAVRALWSLPCAISKS